MVKPEATNIVERPSQGHHEENSLALGDRKYHLRIKTTEINVKQMCV